MRYLINGEEYDKIHFYNLMENDVIDWVYSYIDNIIDDDYSAVELYGVTFKASDIISNCNPTLYSSLIDSEIDNQLDDLHCMLDEEGYCYCCNLKYEVINEDEK